MALLNSQLKGAMALLNSQLKGAMAFLNSRLKGRLFVRVFLFVIIVIIIFGLSTTTRWDKNSDLPLLPQRNVQPCLLHPQRTGETVVVVWNKFFTYDTMAMLGLPPLCSNCTITQDKSRLSEAHAVLFFSALLDFSALPTRKYCNQRWILWSTEPPHNWYWNYQDDVLRSLFDLTVSYRLDADVVMPYENGRWEEGIDSSDDIFQPPKQTYEDKLKFSQLNGGVAALFLASNCKSAHGVREAYIKRLMKHLPVHSVGKCFHNTDITDIHGLHHSLESSPSEATNKLLTEHYFFMLAFENSVCPYYVTEKLHRPLAVSTIPITLGSVSVSTFVPNTNSFVSVNDFDSPRELAQYLKRVMGNKTLYESYFEHKLTPPRVSPAFETMWMKSGGRKPEGRLKDRICTILNRDFERWPHPYGIPNPSCHLQKTLFHEDRILQGLLVIAILFVGAYCLSDFLVALRRRYTPCRWTANGSKHLSRHVV